MCWRGAYDDGRGRLEQSYDFVLGGSSEEECHDLKGSKGLVMRKGA